MRRGELTQLIFMISEFGRGCNRKSFDARFFSGASENAKVCEVLTSESKPMNLLILILKSRGVFFNLFGVLLLFQFQPVNQKFNPGQRYDRGYYSD